MRKPSQIRDTYNVASNILNTSRDLELSASLLKRLALLLR